MSKYIISVKDKPFLFQDDMMAPLDPNKVYEVIEKRTDKRSVLQNRSLHLFCKQVAEALNAKGLGVTAVLKPEIQFSTITIKELLYKPILTALRGKESTTMINTQEMSDVYDIMNKALSEKFDLHVPFPSQEELNFQQNYKERK